MELELCSVAKCYKDKRAVDRVSMKLTKGVYGLLGANGAGKTTLMRMICGVLVNDEGQITWNGEPILSMGEHFREMIGYLPQDFGYYPEFTVMEFMLYIASLKGLSRSVAKQKSKILLRKVGLEANHRTKIKALSGGMRQRLGIAQSMLNDPKLLVLDEPTAGLDVVARNEILDMLRSYIDEHKDCAILMTSHISSDLEELCDDIYMIHNGKVILHEDTDRLLDSYGILKVTEDMYRNMDKSYLLKTRRTDFGYICYTNERQYYLENYPGIIIEKGSIDEMILMMTGHQ